MKEKTIVRGQTAFKGESAATAALAEQLETRARDYLRRCHDTAPSVERHTIWSRLYAASERLSMAVREGDVADAVIEIGSNLLGCEEIVIVQLHAETKLMSFLASVGVSATQRHARASANRGQASRRRRIFGKHRSKRACAVVTRPQNGGRRIFQSAAPEKIVRHRRSRIVGTVFRVCGAESLRNLSMRRNRE
jgi:hypothetical protein